MERNKFIFLVIFFFILQAFKANGQGRWVKSYFENEDAPVKYLIESYDHGYLISGKHGANYSKYNWLIKTDINGEIQWEKTIGDGVNSIVLLDMAQDKLGNTYLGGGTGAYDPESDPLIIKLDPCGEKEWCRVFYTFDNNDYSSCLATTPDGNIAVVLNRTNPDPELDRICLAKLSPVGDLIWKHCISPVDSSKRNEISYNLIVTPDQGFLVTGDCYYEDPEVPNHWISHPYLIKADSSGIFEWETVVFKETNKDGGVAGSSVVSPDMMNYYTSIAHYHFDSVMTSSPALVKLDLNGNVINVYDILPGYETGGKLSYAQFLNDSILAASAGWGNTEDSLWTRAVIIDTLGNLLNSNVLMYDIYTSILQVTNDGKLLYASNTQQNGQFDFYLTKLNQDLEQDSIYTRPFTYDSLCPYQIISDTIVQDDCGLIVGISEEGNQSKTGTSSRLEVFPNPARDEIQVKWEPGKAGPEHECWLEIYDIFGRQAPVPAPMKGKGDWKVNVSNLLPGIYLVILRDEGRIKAEAKFVVCR